MVKMNNNSQKNPSIKAEESISPLIANENARTPEEEFNVLEAVCESTCLSYCERVLRYPSAVTFYTATKNRYNNILPNESTRVKISCSCEGSDYINANYILDKNYISTQAPLPSTFCDFYQMLWECCSPVIVMVTNLTENGKTKADAYWPENLNTETKYGNITVILKEVVESEYYTVRQLELQRHGEVRTIYHLKYSEWNDFAAPTTTVGIRKLIVAADSYKEKVASSLPEVGPITIHCSAGVGRSGTFIAIHAILQRAKTQLQSTNVMDLVHQMRQGRAGMVQTVEQYKFIYAVIKDFESDLASTRVASRSSCIGAAARPRSRNGTPTLNRKKPQTGTRSLSHSQVAWIRLSPLRASTGF